MNTYMLIFPSNSHAVLCALRVMHFQSGDSDPFEFTCNIRKINGETDFNLGILAVDDDGYSKMKDEL